MAGPSFRFGNLELARWLEDGCLAVSFCFFFCCQPRTNVVENGLSSVKSVFMKTFLAIAIVGAALVFPRAVHAQSTNYSINWYTIGGGGGSSSGTNGTNSYTVSGTIGQPATGTMSGGVYSITGGFWSIIAAVQTSGAPLLSVVRSGTQAIISWSASASAFVLEQSSTLMPNSWSTNSAPLTTNGRVISVSVPATSGYQYFRLYNP
jgi:hypothetical protein